MGRITTDQSHQVMAALATNTEWEEIDFEEAGLQDAIIRDPKAGRRFTEFLKTGGFTNSAIEHIVDCDAMPQIFSDWQKEKHQKMGKLKLENRGGNLYANGREVIRDLSEKQKNGKVISGYKLRQELAGKIVLNACVLDYLLEHPELIPEEWKKGVTYFWGTIFRYSDGSLCVACLSWNGDRWSRYCGWLSNNWDGNEPAASWPRK